MSTCVSTFAQTYDSQMLSVVVALGYGGWMAFLLTELLLAGTTLAAPLVPKGTSNGDSTGGSRIGVASMPVGAGVVAFAGCLAFLAATSAPASYYAYFALPCVFWPLAAVRASTLLQRLPPPATGTQRRALLRLTVGTVVIVVLLELMVRAYQLRHLFAVASLVAAAAQLFPIGAPDTASARACTGPALLSSVALAFAGAFAWLPIVQKPQIPAVVAAAAIPALFVPSMLASTAPLPPDAAAQWRLTCGAQLGVLGLTSAIVALPAVASLPLGALDAVSGTLKAAAWAVTLGAPLLPLLAPPSLPHRLASVYLGLLPGFMLVSLSWEPYFLWALGLALAGSVHHELSRCPRDGSSTTGTHRTGLPADRVLVRQALFRPAHALRLAAGYLLLVNLAFFGVGNTASVASFDVPSCYRLTTVFNPFLMGGIMMAKHLTPLLAATAAFTGLLHSLGLRPFDVYPAVLLLADVMSLRFFFQVLLPLRPRQAATSFKSAPRHHRLFT